MMIGLYCIILLTIGSLLFGMSQQSEMAGIGIFLVGFSILFLIEFGE